MQLNTALESKVYHILHTLTRALILLSRKCQLEQSGSDETEAMADIVRRVRTPYATEVLVHLLKVTRDSKTRVVHSQRRRKRLQDDISSRRRVTKESAIHGLTSRTLSPESGDQTSGWDEKAAVGIDLS